MSTLPVDHVRHAPRAAWRTRRWAITGALSITQIVSWGVLNYAFAVFLIPMQETFAASEVEVTGALSAAILISAVAGIAVGRHLDRRSPRALMTFGSRRARWGGGLVSGWGSTRPVPGLRSPRRRHGLCALRAGLRRALQALPGAPRATPRDDRHETLAAALASFL